MKKLTLKRQNHKTPDLTKLGMMLTQLRETLEAFPRMPSYERCRTIDTLLRFQADDGSFSLLDSFEVESDARVDFCYTPTYLCSAILMRALLTDPETVAGSAPKLASALRACCGRGLCGHGYDAEDGLLDALQIFRRGGVKEFLRRYASLSPEFSEMLRSIAEHFMNEGTSDAANAAHPGAFASLRDYFSYDAVFVYGTLLKGERNHAYYLSGSPCLGSAVLTGYRCYDLGSFPGIIPGNGTVKGQLYPVDPNGLRMLDRLEGEGSLYARRLVFVETEDGGYMDALAYIYLGDVTGCEEIPACAQPYSASWRDRLSRLVWYVSYGSNLLEERFLCYLQGGTCRFNGKSYEPTAERTPPAASKAVELPYSMYYSNHGQGSWTNSAVSFLDTSRRGHSYGRAWLISREQLASVHRLEGKGVDWYGRTVALPDIDGLPAFTFTNAVTREKEPFSRVSSAYALALFMGLREAYPGKSDSELYDYLASCGDPSN